MLNVRQVEAFRATVLTGSVTAAAQRMHISQPSVSRLLTDLEATVGFKLFRRHRRGLTPTHEAQLLYAEVERTFAGLHKLEKAVRAFVTSRLGT